MKKMVVSNLKREQMVQLLTQEKRMDGRGLHEYRSIKIESGIIEKAEGSARVKLGDTEVLAGVKIDIGSPFSDRPKDGVLATNAELVPLASAEFEPGPPGEDAIELARVVDRCVRESNAIDLEKICIIPGKKVFVIHVDIYILNHDGNLVDASTLAVASALMNTKIFKYEVKNEVVDIKPGFTDLPLADTPISITLGLLGGYLIVDPMFEEEEVMDAKITMGFSKDGNICAIQKSGTGIIKPQQIVEVAKIAQNKAEELRKFVVKS